ncbi:hypothetical protein Trisim1_011070 [Trichoderma cf. simile WF8]|uniref:VPS9 domain-containing protein n=1 Tax=Trichoderma guizhouense TaxID=1491466 RepID=A0A1T3CHI7_9HYPO|nr:hypothetical protein A0O28_0005500 [Trichoderma guizhouense]
MQPLNPFLSAFFKSQVVAQCTPVHHHILLVPLTDVLLTHRETESGAPAHEVVASEEFLASHVLRIAGPDGPVGAKDSTQNLREARGKARQFNTLNGRSVIVKDSFIYSNKGFKSLAQAQILNDTIWYPDVFEPRQWLVYFISKPLVGTWEEFRLEPAVLVSGTRSRAAAEQQQKKQTNGDSADNALPRKKDIRSFHDLLNHFPMIARQMQPGLEKLFIEFSTVFQKPLPPPPSASYIPDPKPDGPVATAAKRARADSLTVKGGKANHNSLPVVEDFFVEDDEDIMRAALESAVTAAIDIFQGVDKQQLSLLGATTDLTGPLVEKLIERYIAENVHGLLFGKLSAIKRRDDLELEAKIRKMEFIDISQLGIAIDGGMKAKHDLVTQLNPAVEEFRKISTAMSPQEMLDLLLSTMKIASQLTDTSRPLGGSGTDLPSSEKAIMTVNADTLVSLLLYVVIRSQAKNLQARLAYVRNFIFVEDVDSGEMGYALSTFEAVLAYLFTDSAGLRRASRKNKALWDAAKGADLKELRNIMEPNPCAVSNDDDIEDSDNDVDDRAPPKPAFKLAHGSSRRSSLVLNSSDRFSHGTGLGHVFPFQIASGDGANESILDLPLKRTKRVAMDTRSLSSASEFSYHSIATIGTLGSALEGDISVERLAQTSSALGESVLMMAVQSGSVETLGYLLSLSGYYPFDIVLRDVNNENTTLLSAATQLGNRELINSFLDYLLDKSNPGQLGQYFSIQDIWGRSVGHYLFNAPWMIGVIGPLIPWRQRDKNGQTPLFALCRCYDHVEYYTMVEDGIRAAQQTQLDGQPLHVDEHIDGKGNTLLHIMNDPRLALRILQYCDVDVNATNEKKFTALMVASKYGRYDMVRALFADPRVDIGAKELRGLTAVELAKDDDVRNRIDDLGLFSMPPARDGRITGVVRAFFVEDSTVRLVLKSAAPTDHDSYTVTTSRRSLTDFEQLARLLAEENPASWIPSISDTRWPFQLPSRPSRAALRDIQIRTDWFLKIMLSHPTLSTHEMLWEFFLVPELQLEAMEQRTKLKTETRVEKIREEYEPMEDVREVEQFVNHAREMVRSISYSTKSVTRRANAVGQVATDFYDASALLYRAVFTIQYLPPQHIVGMEVFVRAMAPVQHNPQAVFHTTLLAIQSTVQALLSSLARPTNLIGQITAAKREADRNDSSALRPSRWPLGLLDDSRQRHQEEKEKRARQSREQASQLSRELRYTQQTVASELAGWQELHDQMGLRAIREYARSMVVQERVRLEGMMRALRIVRLGNYQQGGMNAMSQRRPPSPPTDQKQESEDGDEVPTGNETSGVE